MDVPVVPFRISVASSSLTTCRGHKDIDIAIGALWVKIRWSKIFFRAIVSGVISSGEFEAKNKFDLGAPP